jgi:hypothetical protein
LQDNAAATLVVGRVHAALTAGKAIWPNSITLQVSGDVDVLDPATGDITNTLSVANPAGIVGGGPDSGMLPPATALLLNLRTAEFIAGRRVRGRAFLSPVYTAGNVGLGVPSAGMVTAANAIGSGLLLGDQAAAHPGVWHRPKAKVGGVFAPVTTTAAAITFAVLKSRRD